MSDTREQTEIFSLQLTAALARISIFMIASAACWLIFNRFLIASPEGFDAVRYEYFARNGLPEVFSDSSSYRMVSLLENLYKYTPYYWGYIFFIGLLSFILSCCDSAKITRFAMFSPISFYYFAQTGKDGIAILSMLAVATISTGKIQVKNVVFVGLMIGLAYYVRPAILLFLPIAFVQFRYGTLYAILLSVGLAFTFMVISDFYQITNILASAVTSYETGAETAILRQYTFGYEFNAVMSRISLLLFSILFQPFLGFVKFYNSGELYLLFDALCVITFSFLILKQNLLTKFVISSVPYVISIGYASPYYHFRYLAVAYPAIWMYSYYSLRPGLLYKDANLCIKKNQKLSVS